MGVGNLDEICGNPGPEDPGPENPNDTLDNGNKLPDTATNQLNWLLLGLFTIAGGLSVFLLNRKRDKVS